IGTDVTGTKALGNQVGVWIDGRPIAPETSREAFGNEVMNNVISGNSDAGVKIDGVGAHDNLVADNRIGTDVTGQLPLANGGHGVVLSGGANHNTIGGTTEAKRNLIAANNGDGVSV